VPLTRTPNITRGDSRRRICSPALSFAFSAAHRSQVISYDALSSRVSSVTAFNCDQADVIIKIGSRGESERFLEHSFEELVGW
jgi:hypothetical protein